jgi:hypothetical protein
MEVPTQTILKIRDNRILREPVIPKESLQGVSAIGIELLKKGGLAEMNDKLKGF